ncbi:hypothetical protein CC2G_006848 [Coprinopsis cinerea AmutBmut pab1-1]|nr:hypothetical protein CC2G_006848 [Coprinopsis cinerea AmutBmut pab1-1]
MAILKCERPNCGETQGLHQGRPIVRDAQGRITRENGWTFDPTTGRCTADDSDYSGRSQPYFRTCFGCFTKSMWVYSSEPPPLPPPTYAGPSHEERALAGEDDEEEYVWSVRRGGKTCGCSGSRCSARPGRMNLCGCAKEGKACSVLCGCGGRDPETGECRSPYTPPRHIDPPPEKKCSCGPSYGTINRRCRIDSNRFGSQCGCAVLGVGCSEECGCAGDCANGPRQGGK